MELKKVKLMEAEYKDGYQRLGGKGKWGDIVSKDPKCQLYGMSKF